MRPLHVAVLDEELPFPANSGKRIRTYNLIRRLADRHRITVVCHRNADPAEAAAADSEFRRLGVETVVVERTVPPKEGPGFYARLAGNLLSPLPYSVATHTSPALASAVRRVAEGGVDVWHCEWTPYAQALRDGLGPSGLRRAAWVVMAHNVESLIWRRYFESEQNPVKRWYVRKQWAKFEKFEKWAYPAATWVVAVSQPDADLIQDRYGAELVEIVDNGVDTAAYRPQRDVDRDPTKALFLGSLDWRPNLDAVAVLLDEVFPAVRQRVPGATLALVGRRPPDWLRQRAAETPGVELFADVPDVRPFLATSGLLTVPLRVGGGSRLKILEAAATATPVVSTAVGAEGLRLLPGKHFTLADTPAERADAMADVMEMPDDALSMADDARREVLREYDWGPLAERLEDVWNAAVKTRATVGR